MFTRDFLALAVLAHLRLAAVRPLGAGVGRADALVVHALLALARAVVVGSAALCLG